MDLAKAKELLKPIAEGQDNSDLTSEERQAVKIVLERLETLEDLIEGTHEVRFSE